MSMKVLKKIVFNSVFLLGGFLFAFGQQDPLYTQYMYNTNQINPAYAGSRGTLSIYGQYRAQWVGLDGAPKTANISVTTPLGQNGLGLGVNFTNDRLGAMDENTISFDLSYAVDLNQDYKLAFGLKGSMNILNIDYTKLDVHSMPPGGLHNIDNRFNGNVGAGLYLYSDKTYVGFSVPMFLENKMYNDNEYSTMKQKLHYYLIGGHVFDLNPNLRFKPAFLMKAVSGAPVQVDLTANFMIAEKVELGAAYRWDASVSALAGFQVNESIFIGYSYDFETNDLKHYNSGSHEVFLRFDLFSNRFIKVSPTRFF